MSGVTYVLMSGALIAVLALAMTFINLTVLGRVRPGPRGGPLVSVCIPARNEQENIEGCIDSVLSAGYTDLEVLVYDDQSTDDTPHILAEMAGRDPRVRRVATQPLPDGWNGKQHACHRMAGEARGEWLLFTDADVRFHQNAIGASLEAAGRLGAGLISAFPRQIVKTPGEALLVPMIFFVLLSYLPFPRMRRTNDPASSAGCGQFLFVSRSAYDASGGHAGFRESMHDGIRLPRAVRRAGMHSDLIDGTAIAECRMYRDLATAWRGFAKNAYEGLGSVALLVFATGLHLIGHIVPWLALFLWLTGVREADLIERVAASIAVLTGVAQRVVISARLRLPMWIAVAHPFGVSLMVAVQWWSWWIALRGRREWRGRAATAA